MGIILKAKNGNAYQISARQWWHILKDAKAELNVSADSLFGSERLSAGQCSIVARSIREDIRIRNLKPKTDRVIDKNLGTTEKQHAKWEATADFELAKFLDESRGLLVVGEEENERMRNGGQASA